MKYNYLIAILLIVCQITKAQISIWVAENGNDTAAIGSESDPFQTIDRAIEAVSVMDNFNEINIYLRQGTYFLERTLKLEKESLGSSSKQINFSSYNNEIVSISGGIKIPDSLWEQNGNIWEADLSTLEIDNTFRQIYVNDVKATRARHDLVLNDPPVDQNTTYYKIIPESTLSSVERQTDLELVTEYKYRSNRIKVNSISGNILYVNPENGVHTFHEKVANILYIENAREFIDEPGEWYYNKQSEMLYYYPRDGEFTNSDNKQVIVPKLEKLITASDVSNITFRNISFCHSSWNFPNDHGYNSVQASHYSNYADNPNEQDKALYVIPASVEFINCSNIIIENCTFRNLGMDALSFDRGSKNNQIKSSTFHNISANAIRIGGVGGGSNTAPLSVNNYVVEDNVIFDIGTEFYTCVGIMLGYVSDVSLINNEIFNAPYSGIHMGWGWQWSLNAPESYALGKINITGNNIHDVLQALSDGGAIYNLGYHEPMSYIQNNSINHIMDHGVGPRCGIYLDEGSCQIQVVNNIMGQPFNKYSDTNKEYDTDVFIRNISCSPVTSHWVERTELNVPKAIAEESVGDIGIRFVDVNHDGLKDLIFHRLNYGQRDFGVYLNLGNKWSGLITTGSHVPPWHIFADGQKDLGVRFVDVTGDGYEDLVYHRILSDGTRQMGAYINTKDGWEQNLNYTPPWHISSYNYADLGVRFVDVNHDGFKDLIFHRYMSSTNRQMGYVLNTGTGWGTIQFSGSHVPPWHIASVGQNDLGVRFVDLNNDGYKDLIYHRKINPEVRQYGAYLNTINGWENRPEFAPPWHITTDNEPDMGVRFLYVDVNQVKHLTLLAHRVMSNGSVQQVAYLFDGTTWNEDSHCKYCTPIPISNDDKLDLGVRFVDLTGDGYDDIVKSLYSDSNLEVMFYTNNSKLGASVSETLSKKAVFSIERINSKEHTLLPENIRISPNPMNDLLNIQFENNSTFNIENSLRIYDLYGNVYKKGKLYKGTNSINCSDLSSGIYIISINSPNYNYTKKIIKL
jgi:hypothetical protein